MPSIRKYLKNIFSAPLPYLQVLCVFLAFAIMVSASFLLEVSIEKHHLEDDAADLSKTIEEQLNSDLRELETMLGVVSETTRSMILNGADFEEVKAYLVGITNYGKQADNILGFVGFFAMFDVFGGIGINGLVPDINWNSDMPGYKPHERPWYIAAEKNSGSIVVTDPYVDAIEHEVTITYARSIYDTKGNRLAIVCLDVMLDRVFKFSPEYRSLGIHSWMMLDRNLNILAYPPYNDFVGIHLSEAWGSGIESVAVDLEQGLPVLAYRYTNPDGDINVFSVRQIEKGWYIGISTPVKSYYTSILSLLWYLIIFGVILASALSAILLRIVAQKNRIQERTKLMLNSSPFGVFFLDKNFMIVDCNPATLKMFGVKDKEKFKAEFRSYSPEYQSNGRLSDELSLEYLEMAFKDGAKQFEWMHRRPDGKPLPVEVTVVRSMYEGDSISIVYLRDLQETKTAIAEKNKAIEEKNMLTNLGNIMNGLDVMIYVTDPVTSEILFINDTMKKHYNIEGDCIGQLCYKLLQKDLEHKCSFCPCFTLDKEPDKSIVWEEHSTLTHRIYRNVDRYIPWPNNKTVHVQHSVDMTELIAAKDAAEQSNRYKSAFLANMSHEIRTPMNAILGIAEIQLHDRNIPPDFEEAFNKIYESGDLLLNIINDILDLSKIEVGKLELNPVRYDIPSLINDTAQINRLRYDNKPIEFIIQVDKNTPIDLYGDELRIKQILNNILSNAFKYTDEGKVEFSVSAEPTPDNSSDSVILVFSVSDTGQGMTERELEKVFDEYTRFNIEANRTTVGAGLGMSITKRLVDMMNGSVMAESTVDQGSVFTVRLPQKRMSSAVCGPEVAENLQNFRFQSTAATKKAQFIREYMPYGHVLVVDDVESNIFVTRGMLLPYGLKIETASSGFEAVEKIRNGKTYDIIFMDHMMPRMDGIETTRVIRNMGYMKSIIALTANALVGRAEMFLKNGFDGFISKPIDSRELNLFLNDFIRNKKPPEVVDAARREQREKGIGKTDAGAQDISKSTEMIRFFSQDAENAIAVLDGLKEKIHDMNEEETDSFVTTVHGMKSALANIGEKELSGMAFKLEQAGEEHNLAVLTSVNPVFMDALRSLVEKFSVTDKVSGNVEISDTDMEFLRRKLLEIKTASAAFDRNTVKTALGELKQKKWPSHISAVLDDISRHILHSAFKKAVATVEEFLQG